MPYTHTTFGQLKSQLSTRLFDVSNVFWVADEITVLLTEALRTYGLLTGFTRDRATFNTDPDVTWYDLRTYAPTQLSATVTDRDIIKSVQYALLESTVSQVNWFGTEQFTYVDFSNACQNRLNQFLSDTGIIVVNSSVPVFGNSRIALSQNTIDVRRIAWLGGLIPVFSNVIDNRYYVPLWRDDERSYTAANPSWTSPSSSTPESFSVMAPPPLVIQLEPALSLTAQGSLDILSVDSTTLTPATTTTVLGIPDDLSPAIKWGMLSDLLGKDGIARDPIRAQYAEQRYQQYVQLARLLPVIIHALVNGNPVIPCTLQELESSTPNWQNNIDTPTELIIAGPNLITFNPRVDDIYAINLDVVSKTPIPAVNSDFVQMGREQLDTLVDYAVNLALFKVGGEEWHATEKGAQSFLLQSATYNQRSAAAIRSVFSAAETSQRQKQGIPRRLDTSSYGIGALKGGTSSNA